ncbi:unknown [Clostridium sp. CAG:451]|nr:unknown [Clostridium sp. CAG:451]
MDKINNQKKKLIIAITLLIIIILGLGITYAWLIQIVNGEKIHSMRVGTFRFSLTEENSLTINSGEFLKDSDGLKQEGFKFTVQNIGKGYGSYSVYLDDDSISSGQTRIDDKFIRYSLGVNTDTTGTPTNLTSRKIYSGGLDASEKDTFVLRLWLNPEVNGDIGGQVFKVKLRIEVNQQVPTPVAEKLLAGVGDNGTIDTSDSEQTFITGTDPNNYIWYSGKLWRAVSIDPSDNSVKLVTQWNISALPYNADGNTAFEGSYMEQWLNDTSVDGFLGNLREPEKFIKTGSVWNATMTTKTTKPAKTTMVTDAVGLLNVYEYTMSSKNVTSSNEYLSNGLDWFTLTPSDSTGVWSVFDSGGSYVGSPANSGGPRPSINLKSTVKIIDGEGTSDNPYRLQGDNDSPVGVLLSTRYSGEYISFGTGENNLYRIVSHENGTGTKIASAIPLKESGSYKTIAFGSNVTFSKDNTIGTFLNGDYLTGGTYLTSDQVNMIEDNTTWYFGSVNRGVNYKLAKYQDETGKSLITTTINAKIGLLRLGELMAGQFDSGNNNITYWTLTPYDTSNVNNVNYSYGYSGGVSPGDNSSGFCPSMNLKSTVKIVSGKGTKSEPFVISN